MFIVASPDTVFQRGTGPISSSGRNKHPLELPNAWIIVAIDRLFNRQARPLNTQTQMMRFSSLILNRQHCLAITFFVDRADPVFEGSLGAFGLVNCMEGSMPAI